MEPYIKVIQHTILTIMMYNYPRILQIQNLINIIIQMKVPAIFTMPS